MKQILLTVTIPFLLVLLGCSGESERESPEGEPIGDTISDRGPASGSEPFLPVLPGKYDPDAPSDAALLVGEVRLVDGCVRVGEGPEGGTVVIWPPETTVTSTAGGGFEIRGYRGNLIARLGDTVGLSGGEASGLEGMPADVQEEIERGACEGPYWVAGQVMSREIWDERYLPYLPVMAGEYDPAEPAPEALFTGVVHIVDGCVRVGKDYPEAREGIVMIWPAESKLVRVGSGPPAFEIRDYRDSLLVRVGDTIRMGGASAVTLEHLSQERFPVDLRQEMQERGCTAASYWIAGHPLPEKYW